MGVKTITIAPITTSTCAKHGTLFEIPFELQGGVFIGPSPEWLKDEKVLKDLRWDEQEAVRDSTLALWIEKDATDQVDLRGPLCLANMALWLAKPTGIGFKFVMVGKGSGDKMSFSSFYDTPGIFPHDNYIRSSMDEDGLRKAREIHGRLIHSEFPKTLRLWTAVRMCWIATTQREHQWDPRHLFLWIALEALFGPGGSGETSHQISERLALFLAKHGEGNASDLYKTAKRGYKWRSQLVHGESMERLGKNDDLAIEISYQTDKLVRRSLHHILVSKDLVEKFGSKEKRNEYLKGLILNQ